MDSIGNWLVALIHDSESTHPAPQKPLADESCFLWIFPHLKNKKG
jgi:hypothetical protein